MNKNIFILALGALISFTSCDKKEAANKEVAQAAPVAQAAQTTPAKPVEKKFDENAPVVKWAETAHDFGTIKSGDVVEHIFKFKNEGKSPLVITSAKSTCGCTVPSYPKTPIAPGEEAEINVKFNSRGKSGVTKKVVTLTTNTNNVQERVEIKASITTPPKAPAAAAPNTPAEKHGFGTKK